MTVNVDPTCPVPPPDGHGQVVLNESESHFILATLATFLLSATALVSVLYWADYAATGYFPPVVNPDVTLIIQLGFLALPGLPFLFGELLLPPCLRITDEGVSLRRARRHQNPQMGRSDGYQLAGARGPRPLRRADEPHLLPYRRARAAAGLEHLSSVSARRGLPPICRRAGRP